MATVDTVNWLLTHIKVTANQKPLLEALQKQYAVFSTVLMTPAPTTATQSPEEMGAIPKNKQIGNTKPTKNLAFWHLNPAHSKGPDSQRKTQIKMELRILQFNINSLLAHVRELRLFLTKNKFDPICIQETFLKTKHTIKFPGYTLVRNDRTDNIRGGGLLILVKKGDSQKLK
jgi:hypothetical protein